MKILAIDTATERCSVALLIDGRLFERGETVARGHAELILPMIDAVLTEAGSEAAALDVLAFGRGPGAFTGVRIAAGVVQGLALGTDVPVAPVSNLEALALGSAAIGERVLVAIDARMGEVYWAAYERTAADRLATLSGERVDPPEAVVVPADIHIGAGTGFKAYPALAARCAAGRVDPEALPEARSIALLGAAALARGEAQPAEYAVPVYLRDQVVRPPAR
ncbi:MAG TPA: tRNA (adenosine(37)-N6)-threonylcarbamoyltransferase complex dimerization subunit type 1 TsaB [Steroidobacteraceae bacterium]|nr:tRNA (adenosine(37)-N6)-threonylcarbamoyltransferase complex dimerization subunit type 1 TsaB [Steroidobacteraceae bacterium]